MCCLHVFVVLLAFRFLRTYLKQTVGSSGAGKGVTECNLCKSLQNLVARVDTVNASYLPSGQKTVWLDGSPVQYTNWGSPQNEETGARRKVPCVILSPQTGTWSRVPCAPGEGRVVCKSPLSKFFSDYSNLCCFIFFGRDCYPLHFTYINFLGSFILLVLENKVEGAVKQLRK